MRYGCPVANRADVSVCLYDGSEYNVLTETERECRGDASMPCVGRNLVVQEGASMSCVDRNLGQFVCSGTRRGVMLGQFVCPGTRRGVR